MKLKLVVLTLFLCLAAAAGATTLAWSVWYAESHTPWAEPDAMERGREALAVQLGDSVKREAEIERLYWNQPEKLQVLIQAHQQRMAKLDGNSAASQVVAHDKEAIAQLQQRIAAIEAEREAQAEAEAAAAKEAALEAKQEELAERAAEQGHSAGSHTATPARSANGSTHP
jgi:hypothetical protein